MYSLKSWWTIFKVTRTMFGLKSRWTMYSLKSRWTIFKATRTIFGLKSRWTMYNLKSRCTIFKVTRTMFGLKSRWIHITVGYEKKKEYIRLSHCDIFRCQHYAMVLYIIPHIRIQFVAWESRIVHFLIVTNAVETQRFLDWRVSVYIYIYIYSSLFLILEKCTTIWRLFP